MRHPNGVVLDYPSGSTYTPLTGATSIVSPINAASKWYPYTRQIMVLHTFYRESTTPISVASVTQSGETWTKLIDVSKTFNNSVMYAAAWLRETNNDAYTAIYVSFNGWPSSGTGFAQCRRTVVAAPGELGKYKPIKTVGATSQGLTTYTPNLSAVASGTFNRIDYMFNARYANPVVTGYQSVPSVSYSSSDMTYGFGGDNNLTNIRTISDTSGSYFSGFIETFRTAPSLLSAAPTDANPVPSWTPISAGAIPYNNMCVNPGSSPETYTQRYTETIALSLVIPSYNYSQVM